MYYIFFSYRTDNLVYDTNFVLKLTHIITSRRFAHLMRNILYIPGVPPGGDQCSIFKVILPRPTLKWPSIN